jgi:hypothetical protein
LELVTKTVDNPNPLEGETIVCLTINVENNGPSDATNVELTVCFLQVLLILAILKWG